MEELKSKGYEAFITTVDMGSQLLYRVQVGAYSIRANAERMRDNLLEKGYDAIIIQA